MYKITRNIWIDNRRSAALRGFHAEIDDGVMQIADDSHARMEASMELNDVDKAMAKLPDEQREVTSILVRCAHPIVALSLTKTINKEPFAQAVAPGREMLVIAALNAASGSMRARRSK